MARRITGKPKRRALPPLQIFVHPRREFSCLRSHVIALALIARTEPEPIIDMPQLIVRQIEEKVVRKLKQQAGEHGVSMEEEHRRILREALLGSPGKRLSFKEYLQSMPDVGPNEVFARGRHPDREVEL